MVHGNTWRGHDMSHALVVTTSAWPMRYSCCGVYAANCFAPNSFQMPSGWSHVYDYYRKNQASEGLSLPPFWVKSVVTFEEQHSEALIAQFKIQNPAEEIPAPLLPFTAKTLDSFVCINGTREPLMYASGLFDAAALAIFEQHSAEIDGEADDDEVEEEPPLGLTMMRWRRSHHWG
jgi:hypothetical protein